MGFQKKRSHECVSASVTFGISVFDNAAGCRVVAAAIASPLNLTDVMTFLLARRQRSSFWRPRSAVLIGVRVTLAVIVLCAAPRRAAAAEWSKLKTCDDLSFCRRQRSGSASGSYAVDGEDVALVTWRGVRALRLSLVEGGPGTEGAAGGAEGDGSCLASEGVCGPGTRGVFLFVAAVAGGGWRLVVDEEGGIGKRHFVGSAVVGQNEGMRDLGDRDVHVGDGEVVVGEPEDGEGGGGKVRVRFGPSLRVGVYDRTGEEVAVLNEKDMFRFEKRREKPVSSSTPAIEDEKIDATEENVGASGDDSDKVTEDATREAVEGDVEVEPAADEGDAVDMSGDDDYNTPYDEDFSNEDLAEHEVGASGEGAGDSVNDVITVANEKPTDESLWEESFQSHTDPKVRGPESFGADISFPFAQHVYGIPERTEKVSLPNTVAADGSKLSEPFRLYNLDVFEFELDKALGLYGSVPLMIAKGGAAAAAVLWLSAAETYVDVLETSAGAGKVTHWWSESGVLDLYVMASGSLSRVWDDYRKLTGPASMPQRFALGYHQCRWNYRDEADVYAVDSGFEEHEIPYDVLWLDIEHTDGKRYFTWDMAKFPNPTEMQFNLGNRGKKMVTIIDPHVKRDKNYAVHKAAEDNGYYVQTPEGKTYEGWCWPGSSSYYDFSSPVARQAWADRFNPTDYPHFTRHLYTWVDMNEPSVFNGPEATMPKHMIHSGGVEHRDIHNQFGFFVQQATHEGLLKGHGGDDRPFVLSRSFFAGSQRYGAVWTGDNTAGWDHLESTARMLLPLQITGIVFSGADVGGFFGNPSPELLVRWYQTAAFQPFFRGHAHLDTNRREPWLFGTDNTALIADAIRVRYSYLPLWYTVMASAALGDKLPFTVTGSGPPMRPVWWEFDMDSRTDSIEDQWMIGSSLLVAPVLKEGATQRTVYLPSASNGKAIWYDVFAPHGLASSRLSGGRDIAFDTPLSRMLVFQRGGSIVPKQERRRRSTGAMARDPYSLVIALDSEGEAVGDLYMDDGETYGFERGANSLRQFVFSSRILRVSTVTGGGGAGESFLSADAVIERIVILGLRASGDSKPVEKACIKKGGKEDQSTEVDIVVGLSSDYLTVRKPDVGAAAGSWTIELL